MNHIEFFQSISHYTSNAFTFYVTGSNKTSHSNQSGEHLPKYLMNLVLTSNMKEKQVTKLEECLTETLA